MEEINEAVAAQGISVLLKLREKFPSKIPVFLLIHPANDLFLVKFFV